MHNDGPDLISRIYEHRRVKAKLIFLKYQMYGYRLYAWITFSPTGFVALLNTAIPKVACIQWRTKWCTSTISIEMDLI